MRNIVNAAIRAARDVGSGFRSVIRDADAVRFAFFRAAQSSATPICEHDTVIAESGSVFDDSDAGIAETWLIFSRSGEFTVESHVFDSSDSAIRAAIARLDSDPYVARVLRMPEGEIIGGGGFQNGS